MQTIIHVHCSRGQSLREIIAKDSRLGAHMFVVATQQRSGRAPGWLKLRSTESDRHGAINIEWNGRARVLECRVVTRGKGTPNLIVGDFLEYMLARFRRRIQVITLIPK